MSAHPPVPHAIAARRGAGGFTLIEVLLATVLLAAGLALAFATLRAATATAQRGEAIAQRNEHMRAVEQFLRRRLTAARPVGFQVDESTGLPLRFAGGRDRMRFVADLPDYLGRGGPHLHDVRVVESDDAQSLEVGFSLVMAGQTLAEAEARPPETLATRLEDVRFRYRGIGADNQLGEWRDEWDQGDRLPLQVQVLWRDAGGREWPPLVVALPLAGGYGGEIGGQQ